MSNDSHLDDDTPLVFIILGTAYEEDEESGIAIHVMLAAADEDSAVRETLEALAREGYIEAELDQIGTLDGAPDEEPHASAYQGALEGEVSIIKYNDDA